MGSEVDSWMWFTLFEQAPESPHANLHLALDRSFSSTIGLQLQQSESGSSRIITCQIRPDQSLIRASIYLHLIRKNTTDCRN